MPQKRGLTRERVGEEDDAIVTFWLETMHDDNARMADRLEASRLLAERGWGKAAAFIPIEHDDPLGLSDQELDEAESPSGAFTGPSSVDAWRNGH